jgi:hypothetical protein
MDNPLQRLTFDEILFEIRQAEKEKREADLSNKLLPEFSLTGKTINVSLNLEGSTIQGAMYLNGCIINGDIKLNNSLIYTTVYINESEINNFFGKKIKIREVLNFSTSKIKNNLDIDGGLIKGFIGLNRVEIGQDIIFNNIQVKDIMTKSGNMKGDLYIRNCKILGNVYIVGSFFDGLGNFEDSTIEKTLDLSNAKFLEVVDISRLTINGEALTKTLECKNLISHM